MDVFSRKREREDDVDEWSFAPSHKRIQSSPLPFREFPTMQHTRGFSHSKRNNAPRPLFTQTLTPNDSDEECTPPMESVATFGGAVQAKLEAYQADVAMDMCASPTLTQIELDPMMLSPKASPRTIDPPAHFCNGPDSAARIPTPIYGHFQQSLELNPIVVDTGLTPPLSHYSPDLLSTSPCDKSASPMEKGARILRLPTPISEDEAMDTFDETECDSIIPEISPSQLRQPARLAQPLPSTSPKRAKPMFSMGFRSDCEMCRNRMPGHYNHIFRP